MKKVLSYIAIFLGVIMFTCCALVVIMMLAPGTEIFGIKYISAAVGKYEEKVVNTFYNKDIYIYAYDVPIQVKFDQPGDIGITYVQNYQGFTKSENYPSVELKNLDGEAYDKSLDNAVAIHLNQYQEFVWSNSLKEHYFILNLTSYKQTNSINIITTNSEVSFSGLQTLRNLSLQTNKAITLDAPLTITNELQIKTSSDVIVKDSIDITGNVSAEINNGSLTIDPIVYGNVNFKTQGGNLKINSCQNLTVESSSGSILKPTGGKIDGNLNFKTTSGNVEIPAIYGDVNKISSTSGTIKIDNCTGDLTIETNRANATVSYVDDLTFSSTTGNLVTNNVSGNLIASATLSGDIECGYVAGNAKIITKEGSVTIKDHIDGNADITTVNGNTQMVSCANLKFTSQDGSLSHYGSNKIVVNGEATISTRKGNITLGAVTALANTINSDNGDINVLLIEGNVSITSYNSAINLGSVKSATIKSSYSTINIGKAPQGLNITNSGNVTVGTDGEVGDLVLKANNGKAVAKNTVGKVEISSNAEVELTNKNSTNILINYTKNATDYVSIANGKVTATGLKGDVRIYSKGNVDVVFTDISGNVRIDTKGDSALVRVNAINNKLSDIYYWLNSTNGKNYIYQGGVVLDTEGKGTYGSQDSAKLKIITTNAKVELYLAA